MRSEWKWSQYMHSQCGKLLTQKSGRIKFLTNFISDNIVGLNPPRLWWNTKRSQPPRLIVSRFQRCSLIKNAQLNGYRPRKAWCYTQQYPQCWAGQMIKQASNQTRKIGQETRLNCKDRQLCPRPTSLRLGRKTKNNQRLQSWTWWDLFLVEGCAKTVSQFPENGKQIEL